MNFDDVKPKSEFRQLFDYINKKSNNKKKTKTEEVEKKKINNEKNIYIPNNIKSFIRNIDIFDSDKFKNFINKSIIKDIQNEISVKKNFFSCFDIVGCHRKIFYELYGYDPYISESYVYEYKKHIQKVLFKNIILDLSNFKENNIFIEYDNKIKDFIPIIQDNILIDFVCNSSTNYDVFRLKALLFNLSNNNKIENIKAIKFNNSFFELEIIDIPFNHKNNDLIKLLKILENYIKKQQKPKKIITNDCEYCLYKKVCIPNKSLDEKKPNIKKLNPATRNSKHKFLL